MSAFGGLFITNRGRNLQAKAQTGTQLTFTRMGIGDGELGGSSIPDLNALKHEVLSLSLTELKVLTGGKARVRSILSNQEIVTGFYFREIGIFAQDPDLGEILYCYGNAGANAEYIPAGGGPDIIEKRMDVITLIGNAAAVSAVIDESLLFVTLDDFEAHINGTDPHPIYTTETEVINLVNLHKGESDPHSQYATDADLLAHLAENPPHVPYAVASGTANSYVVSLGLLSNYAEGMALAVKINVDNTEASTINVNNLGEKSIKKSNGNDVSPGNLKAGSVYTLRYNGVNFILQGEGGEALQGNAIAGDVLSGKTFYNTDPELKVTGVMPNRGAVTHSLPVNGVYTLPAGYHNGSGQVTQSIATKGAQIYTPGTVDQTIAAGQYLTGMQTIKGDANLVAGNIKSGVSIFGTTGSLIPVSVSIQSNSDSTTTGGTSYVKTINAVDLTRSVVLLSSCRGATASIPAGFATAKFLSNTQIEIRREATGCALDYTWTVIEFGEGVIVQSGTNSPTTSSDGYYKTISAVDLSRAIVLYTFSLTDVEAIPYVRFVDSTHLQIRARSNAATVNWFVVEFPAQ